MSELSLNNPNNCLTCDHKQNPDGGWCYMFSSEPVDAVCFQHTGRRELTADAFAAMFKDAFKLKVVK